jgi:outer membrane protein assembly factor BamE (lipoprotein component of BamABCDE complex)
MIKNIFFVIFMAIVLSGCGVAAVAEGSNNRAKLMQINIGDSKDQLLKVMGNPELREAYPEGEVWLYYTGTGFGYNHKTPVVIVNGKIVGWGDNYYDRVIKKKIDLNVTTNK